MGTLGKSVMGVDFLDWTSKKITPEKDIRFGVSLEG